MYRCMGKIVYVAPLLLSGCFQFGSGTPGSDASDGTEGTDSSDGIHLNSGQANRVPSDDKALFAYLSSGKYKSFKQLQLSALGGAAHEASALRVYYNAPLYQSLTTGTNFEHPAQAAAIAERYDNQGNVRGWVVSVKVNANSDGGQGWYWYAVDSTVDASKLIASGLGLGLCSNCHAGGADYVLSARAY
jgi:hypothetical protein